FLTTFFLGFMLVSMAMVIVRGEAPLEPWTFLRHYLLLAPPPILFVSALALLFECVPWLSGRGGDVAYFFVFMLSMTLSTVAVINGTSWGALFDPSGMAAVLAQNIAILHTKSISIGAGPFDPHKPPIVYPGLSLGHGFLLQRLVSMLVPLPLLLLARASFHRFDPVRVRVAPKAERRWLARLNALLKPLTRVLLRMPAARSLPLAAVADAQLSVALVPGVAIAAIVSIALPRWIAFLVMAISISDVASRDARANTLSLLYAAPRLREHFVAWKTMSASILAAVFVLRHLLDPACVAGAFFTVAAAVALGTISGNAKTFIVLFLSFWYIVVSDKGATAALDFAGFYGKASLSIPLTYAAIGAALLALATLIRRR
ncbi:MAG TPA: hypothetical protein VG323_13850, partial [Thermoanaerobaculia bacterium]|nr:hypothetical protein [Thermoanaerobaculia bacterium]